jgi:hypothetical protein
LLSASGFRHAFFSRDGGVSQGPFATLNFSVTVGDEPAAVAENLARAARALQVLPERVLFLDQVHGTACERVDRTSDAAQLRRCPGDAVVSADSQVACAVRVADCAPILLADRASGVVAAVHSGWRGTLQDIAAATVLRLRELSGRQLDLVAAIGPHIEACCFEVGDEVAAELLEASPDKAIVHRRDGARPHVDLRRMLHAQLHRAGVREIEHVGGCTFCQPDRLFSYRRDGKRSGRHLAAIVARS